jgi:hypothetical protein
MDLFAKRFTGDRLGGCMMEKLPPVVYGDPVIDKMNAYLWSLEVPKHSDEIQRLQLEVVELERKHWNGQGKRKK